MFKKGAVIFLLLGFLAFTSGCETVKGAFQGTASGMKKDWSALMRADDWMRANYW